MTNPKDSDSKRKFQKRYHFGRNTPCRLMKIPLELMPQIEVLLQPWERADYEPLSEGMLEQRKRVNVKDTIKEIVTKELERIMKPSLEDDVDAKLDQCLRQHWPPAVHNTPAKSDLDRLNEMLAKNQVVFITGRAGTGKTTLLREWIMSRGDDGLLLTASTGNAAQNASCDDIRFKTVHSAFWIHEMKPIIDRDETVFELRGVHTNDREIYEDEAKRIRKMRELLNQLAKYHTLVIEEVSMIRSDVMDRVDFLLQKANNNQRPFGGVKVVLCGDLAQLPPVVKDDETKDVLPALLQRYGGIYFFNNQSIEKLRSMGKFGTLELKVVRRQNDPLFIKILDRARTGQITREDLEIINSARNQSEHAVVLASIRKTVDQINRDKLNNLPYRFEITTGQINRYDDPQEICFKYPSPPNPLALKVGARVMIIKNGDGYHNGSLGEYLGIYQDNDDDGYMEIMLDNGNFIHIERDTQKEYRTKYQKETDAITQTVIAEYTQFPVILAYALTVHRSQGQSFNHVEFRRGRSWNFGHGLIYTMLSRCRSLEGLNIVDPLSPNDFVCDQSIMQYIQA